MTVALSTRKTDPFTATAGQTVFNYDFPIDNAADMQVLRLRNGVVTTLELDVDYGVTNVGADSGTFVLATGANDNDIFVAVGALKIERISNFPGWRSIPDNAINKELDRMTKALQEMRRQVDQTLIIDPFSGSPDAHGLRIINVADAQDGNDAVNYTQLQEAVFAKFDIAGLDPLATPAGNDLAVIWDVSENKAVKVTIDELAASIIGDNDVEVFKGVIDCSANPNFPAADAGDIYRVSAAGKIGGALGINVEVGDRLECIFDATPAGDQATVGSHWWITQSNIDGAVIGPTTANDNDFVLFNGTTGKLIKGGISLDTDGTFAASSDTRVASQKAIKTYIANSVVTNSPFINVKDYGVVGDGVADDTAAIQAALNAGIGLMVFFPAGFYKITSHLLIPDNCEVFLSNNAVIRADAAMDAIFYTDANTVHLYNVITGGSLDCNDNADTAIWAKNFNAFIFDRVEIKDNKVSGLRLGNSSGPNSYGAEIRNIFINRPSSFAPTGSKGIHFEKCGDSEVFGGEVIGQDYGVYGSQDDSKFYGLHVWAYPPTHGNVTAGFYNTGGDTHYIGCQVDGPVTSTCWYIAGQRCYLTSCGTNNNDDSWSNDNVASCVAVETGASCVVRDCSFKGGASHRFSADIHVNAGGDCIAEGNLSVNCVVNYGNRSTEQPVWWGSSAFASIESYADDAFGSFLYVKKSRNATRGAHTIVQNGDIIGGLTGGASDGVTFQAAAQVLFKVDGTPGANDMPGSIVFATTADGAASPTNRWIIDSNGNFKPGADNSYQIGTASAGLSNFYLASAAQIFWGGVSQPKAGVTNIASGNTTSGTTVTITNIPLTYAYLKLSFSGISCDTATRHLQIQCSTDNGATWDTTAGSYVGFMAAGSTITSPGEASVIQTADVAAANAFSGFLIIAGSDNYGCTFSGRISNGATNYHANYAYIGGSSGVNAIRLLWNGSGNFDAGSYSLVGIA